MTLAVLMLGAPAAAQNDSLEVRTREIASNLECPVCTNLSVADSPSDLATEMRGVIRQKLAEGQSREQIEAYFVSRYGEQVLREPPRSGFALLVWVWPYMMIAIGAVVLLLGVRRWTRRRADEPTPVFIGDDFRRYEQLLDEELDQRRRSET